MSGEVPRSSRRDAVVNDDGMWIISDNTEVLGSTRTLSILFHIKVHLPRIVSSRPHPQNEPSMALLITSTNFEGCCR